MARDKVTLFLPGTMAFFCQNCEGFGTDPRQCVGCGDATSIVPALDLMNRTVKLSCAEETPAISFHEVNHDQSDGS